MCLTSVTCTGRDMDEEETIEKSVKRYLRKVMDKRRRWIWEMVNNARNKVLLYRCTQWPI